MASPRTHKSVGGAGALLFSPATTTNLFADDEYAAAPSKRPAGAPAGTDTRAHASPSRIQASANTKLVFSAIPGVVPPKTIRRSREGSKKAACPKRGVGAGSEAMARRRHEGVPLPASSSVHTSLLATACPMRPPNRRRRSREGSPTRLARSRADGRSPTVSIMVHDADPVASSRRHRLSIQAPEASTPPKTYTRPDARGANAKPDASGGGLFAATRRHAWPAGADALSRTQVSSPAQPPAHRPTTISWSPVETYAPRAEASWGAAAVMNASQREGPRAPLASLRIHTREDVHPSLDCSTTISRSRSSSNPNAVDGPGPGDAGQTRDQRWPSRVAAVPM